MRNEQGNEGKRIDGNGNAPGDRSSAQIVKAEGGSTIQNVIQAIVHLVVSPWGLAILAIGLVVGLVSSAIVLVQPKMHPPTPTTTPTFTPTPTLTPTPMAFEPASEGQSLIIVADFDDRSGGKHQGVDPAQYIYERLVAQSEKDELDARIERLYQVVNDNTVRSVGKAYNATLVLWGWYDTLTITLRVERIKTVATYHSIGEGQHLSLAVPEKVEFSIVTDLPSQATYLTLFTLGVDKFTNGDVREARDYFEGAWASLPNDVKVSINPSDALFYLGNCDYVLGIYISAVEYYLRAIKSNPNMASAYVNLGNLYLLEGDRQLASDRYERAVEIEPGSAIAYINLALLQASEGDLSRALELATTAINLDDSHRVFAFGARGAIYAETGQWENAAEDLTRAIEQDETFALAYVNRGLAYREMGYLDQAIADLEQAIELDPNIAEAYYNRALVYIAKGEYLSAIADLTKAIGLEPEGIGDVSGLIMVPYNMFLSQTKTEHRMESRSSVHLAEFYHVRGKAYESLGQVEEAKKDYLKAAEIYSQLAKASQVVILVLDRRELHRDTLAEFGCFDKAIVNYASILDIDPLYTDAYYGRGVAYYHLREFDMAVADFDKAIDLEPNRVDAYLGRGMAYAEMGRYEQAIADFTKAIEIKPNLEAAYSDRAQAYEQMSSYEQAIADYSKAVEIDNSLLEIYFGRGVLYKRLGYKDLAIADFERVLEVGWNPELATVYRELLSQAEQHLKELKGE